MPSLRSRFNNFRLGWLGIIPDTMSPVPSGELSSTTRTSTGKPSSNICSISERMLSDSLQVAVKTRISAWFTGCRRAVLEATVLARHEVNQRCEQQYSSSVHGKSELRPAVSEL